MTPMVYAAKTVLFDRLTALAAPGQPLAGLQVAYAFPREPGPECVYGGGVRFSHADAVAERGVLIDEDAQVSVYIRVRAAAPAQVRDTDARVTEICGQLTAALNAAPTLYPGLVWQGIGAGQGDYDQSDNETVSILAVQMRVAAALTYGTP